MAGYSETEAADALDQGQQDQQGQGEEAAETPQDDNATEEQSEESTGRDDTLFLPQDFPNAANLKKGDRLTFVVLGSGQDGVEVECENTGQKGSDWKSDLRKSMS
jgi:hypothetical protein